METIAQRADTTAPLAGLCSCPEHTSVPGTAQKWQNRLPARAKSEQKHALEQQFYHLENCIYTLDGAHPERGDALALQEAAQIVEIRVWQRHPDGGPDKAEAQREGTQLAQVRRAGPRFIRPSTRALVYATCQEGPQGLVCI